MKRLLGLLLLLLIGCEGNAVKTQRLADEREAGIRHDYINRYDSDYVNQYFTRFVTPIGDNIHRMYDPVMEMLCYSVAQSINCAPMKQDEWNKRRAIEIKDADENNAATYKRR